MSGAGHLRIAVAAFLSALSDSESDSCRVRCAAVSAGCLCCCCCQLVQCGERIVDGLGHQLLC